MDTNKPKDAVEALDVRTGSGCSFLLDCKGREICVGDVIRVKHYATRHGRGYRQHWMYKLVIEKLALGTEHKADFLKVLSLQDPAKTPHSYYEQLTGKLRDDIEIVDGVTEDADGRLMSFDERPRRRPNDTDQQRRDPGLNL